ncbi:MAG: hypothetical protein EOO17_01190 [Chloroflexi bacterium]|nr:MAG: hypothetical protein EOO17_01190 [Chloroflexota bacterium]
MSNSNPNTQQLKATQWKRGVSGNPLGKPKGTRHVSTLIRTLLESPSTMYTLDNNTTVIPIEAIIGAMVSKAANGDVRAFEVLVRYGYGAKIEVEGNVLPIPILGGASQSILAESTNLEANS